jgi:hypothetical protein
METTGSTRHMLVPAREQCLRSGASSERELKKEEEIEEVGRAYLIEWFLTY